MTKPIVGIDLGTSNSLVSVWKDSKSVLIPNAHGKFLTPSCVNISDTGEILVGQIAKDMLITHPSSTFAAFKRYMGTNRKIMLSNQTFRAEDLSSFILKSLKSDAEVFLNEPVQEAVITVPAYFNDIQRKATQHAGILAGLDVQRLINEPTAAALAYGLSTNQANKDSQIMILDLGGGTFDVTLLETFAGVMEVKASTGDNFLGGEDFVEAIVNACFKHLNLQKQHISPQEYSRIWNAAEKAKCELSNRNKVEMTFVYKDKQMVFELTAEIFESISASLMSRIRKPIERALRDSKVTLEQIDHIVLAGGATRMPIVKTLVAKIFGKFPLMNLNPDEIVAMGAGVQTGLILNDQVLNEIVLTDVCPYTLGVNTNRGYHPMINRNTVIPASRSNPFFPVDMNQTAVSFEIYQGESFVTEDNIFLGDLTVRFDPSLENIKDKKIDLRFTYDVSGVLEVESTVVKTGKMQKIIIENNPGVLSKSEIQDRLVELSKYKIHPREDTKNMAILAEANRVFEEYLEYRDEMAQYIHHFNKALNDQEPDKIKAAYKLLRNFLDEISGFQNDF